MAVNKQPAEAIAVLDVFDGPAAPLTGRDELIASLPHVSAAGSSEEVKIARWTRGELLCYQSRASGE